MRDPAGSSECSQPHGTGCGGQLGWVARSVACSSLGHLVSDPNSMGRERL